MRPILVCVLALVLCGCATVKPWQRGRLGAPVMSPVLGDPELANQYRSKVVESRTGGGVPGVAPGGGCGCTQ